MCNLLQCNETLWAHVTYSVTHLQCVNVISSQHRIQKLSQQSKALIELRLDYIFSVAVWKKPFLWYDSTLVPQTVSLKTFRRASLMVLWPEWLCSNGARPRRGANSWGWDAHSFSSVYHAGKGFQKLSSHKNSMHLNVTAHFQSQVIFCDNTVFFVSTVRSRRAPDRTFTGNYSSSALVKVCL